MAGLPLNRRALAEITGRSPLASRAARAGSACAARERLPRDEQCARIEADRGQVRVAAVEIDWGNRVTVQTQLSPARQSRRDRRCSVDLASDGAREDVARGSEGRSDRVGRESGWMTRNAPRCGCAGRLLGPLAEMAGSGRRCVLPSAAGPCGWGSESEFLARAGVVLVEGRSLGDVKGHVLRRAAGGNAWRERS